MRKEVKLPRLPSIRSKAVTVNARFHLRSRPRRIYQAARAEDFRGGFPQVPVLVGFGGFVLTGDGLRTDPPLGMLIPFHHYGASRLRRSTCA